MLIHCLKEAHISKIDKKRELFSAYRIRRILGGGSEGIVYLAGERNGSQRLILKVFHEAHSFDWFPGLPVYARHIKANNIGLPAVNLLTNNNKEVIAVVYPYVPLFSIHWRILNFHEKTAQSIVGSYCLKQYYLMTKFGLVLWDPPLHNIMVDRSGSWHYCDIGGGIGLLNSPYIHKLGLLEYGFLNLILSIYHKTLHNLIMPSEDYSYDTSCTYWDNEWLKNIAMKHEWVQDIYSMVRNHKPSIFYDPIFYKQIGDSLPTRVSNPLLTLFLSQTLSLTGKLRGKLKSLSRALLD